MSDFEGRQILELSRDVLDDGDEQVEFMMDGRRLLLRYDWHEKKLIWAIASIPPDREVDGAGELDGVGPHILGILERAFKK